MKRLADSNMWSYVSTHEKPLTSSPSGSTPCRAWIIIDHKWVFQHKEEGSLAGLRILHTTGIFTIKLCYNTVMPINPIKMNVFPCLFVKKLPNKIWVIARKYNLLIASLQNTPPVVHFRFPYFHIFSQNYVSNLPYILNLPFGIMEASSISTISGFLVPMCEDTSFVYLEVFGLSTVTCFALLHNVVAEFPDTWSIVRRLQNTSENSLWVVFPFASPP